jgi:phosphatidate cytidylyltransferase
VLKHRIITALIMVILFVGVLFLPAIQMVLIFSLVVVVAAWEWAQLADFAGLQKIVYAAVVGLLLVAMGALVSFEAENTQWLAQTLGSATTLWAILLCWVITYPASAAVWGSKWARSLLGLIILSAVWLAMAFLSFSEQGPLLILYIIAVVAFTDIGAYFSGLTFGKHKFAPAVSPKKTWEGFFGGVVAAGLMSYLVATYYGLLNMSVAQAVALSVVCAAASALGDLAVSMLKRQAGVKDSSNLLPGHGGFLDRIDGILAAMPMFAFGLLMVAK